MMAMYLNPWHILLLATAGWMNREQAEVVEYLEQKIESYVSCSGQNAHA